jgi:hypothetical protein
MVSFPKGDNLIRIFLLVSLSVVNLSYDDAFVVDEIVIEFD